MPSIEGTFVFLLNYVGRLVCHQLPERTLWIGGNYLPVCARDTGVYLGFILGYLLLTQRKKEAKGPPNLWMISIMAVPMIVDAGTQWIGLRTSTNELRLVTGLLFGAAIAPLLVYSLSVIPASKRVPVLRNLLPETANFDDKNHWLSFRSLGLGVILALILYFALALVVGSANSLFYWLLSPLIIASAIVHVFLLPVFIIALAVFSLKRNT